MSSKVHHDERVSDRVRIHEIVREFVVQRHGLHRHPEEFVARAELAKATELIAAEVLHVRSEQTRPDLGITSRQSGEAATYELDIRVVLHSHFPSLSDAELFSCRNGGSGDPVV